MANKRMFNNSVIQTDDFLRLPHSAITLYFFLNVTADNEGFNAAPEDVMKRTRTSTDDMQLLLQKRFVLLAGNGVIVIRHWFIHNYVRPDRYKSQISYMDEKKKIGFDEAGLYVVIDETEADKLSVYDMIQMNGGKPLSLQKINELSGSVYKQLDTTGGIPVVDTGEEREGEVSKGEIRIGESSGIPYKYTEDHLYGINKNVLLSDEELDEIYRRYKDPDDLIDKVSFIFLNSSKRYSSHYGFLGKIAIEDKWPKRKPERPKELSDKEKEEVRINETMALYEMTREEAIEYLNKENEKAAEEAMTKVREMLGNRA